MRNRIWVSKAENTLFKIKVLLLHFWYLHVFTVGFTLNYTSTFNFFWIRIIKLNISSILKSKFCHFSLFSVWEIKDLKTKKLNWIKECWAETDPWVCLSCHKVLNKKVAQIIFHTSIFCVWVLPERETCKRMFTRHVNLFVLEFCKKMFSLAARSSAGPFNIWTSTGSWVWLNSQKHLIQFYRFSEVALNWSSRWLVIRQDSDGGCSRTEDQTGSGWQRGNSLPTVFGTHRSTKVAEPHNFFKVRTLKENYPKKEKQKCDSGFPPESDLHHRSSKNISVRNNLKTAWI